MLNKNEESNLSGLGSFIINLFIYFPVEPSARLAFLLVAVTFQGGMRHNDKKQRAHCDFLLFFGLFFSKTIL